MFLLDEKEKQIKDKASNRHDSVISAQKQITNCFKEKTVRWQNQ